MPPLKWILFRRMISQAYLHQSSGEQINAFKMSFIRLHLGSFHLYQNRYTIQNLGSLMCQNSLHVFPIINCCLWVLRSLTVLTGSVPVSTSGSTGDTGETRKTPTPRYVCKFRSNAECKRHWTSKLTLKGRFFRVTLNTADTKIYHVRVCISGDWLRGADWPSPFSRLIHQHL